MRMTIEERERKFRATFESHNLDRFFAFAQDLMCDCSAADYAQTVWMDRERELKQRIKELEAERGTTPPEGLAFTFEEFIDMSLRHNKRLAAGISGIASFGHWYNELAATQRAPVEQGRGEIRCDNCGEDTELDQCPKCGNGLKARREKLQGAPDHAREGALREAVIGALGWAESNKIPVKSVRDIWRRALADGKEGGE